MANIEQAQYIQYEKWCRKRFGGISPRQSAQVDLLKELDVKCQRCMAFGDEKMLCDGMRLTFSEEHIDDLSTPRLHLQPCKKAASKMQIDLQNRKLKSAGFAREARQAFMDLESFRTNCSVVFEDGMYLVNSEVLPLTSWEYNDPVRVHRIKEYMVAMVRNGFQPKYLALVDYFRAWTVPSEENMHLRFKDHVRLIQAPLMECDWLVVESLDQREGAAVFRAPLFEVIRWRIAQYKPLTIVRRHGEWLATSVEDQELFREVDKWPRLGLR